jgi:hypothetical protein
MLCYMNIRSMYKLSYILLILLLSDWSCLLALSTCLLSDSSIFLGHDKSLRALQNLAKAFRLLYHNKKW